ncbi:MAG: hypothetical protein A3B10_04655 [Candidatus Doudnabacteria bacterium RIFCSPLOWO2_01_FULL_44_21]|uniref:Uncharacterized protein n=1 Tax=Candidatus Doudnabacteria bacterium RIFCSPLOWO2_01_FULL_44_21 TaxID=1817841 RepID=A0A1F5PYA7_9BACT|nr:MAG: hypothetical protein A3B10_04655 [Candidatus Doudnabacteria bacterium RIFCSPLOWO2_01_FULL_44_21]
MTDNKVTEHNKSKEARKGKHTTTSKILETKPGYDNMAGITSCLSKVMDGLHIDFVGVDEGGSIKSFVVLTLHDKAIAGYELKWPYVIPAKGKLHDVHTSLLKLGGLNM